MSAYPPPHGDMRQENYTRRQMPDGTSVIATEVGLPSGWNRSRVTVQVVLPIAYPSAQPDCFYTDADLRLANGAMPTNTGIQHLDGQQLLWFSWHLSAWSPATDNISTYLRFVERRFRDVR